MKRILASIPLVACGLPDVEIELVPESAHVEDVLVASVVSKGEPVEASELELIWTRDEVVLDGEAGLELSLASFERGQVVGLSAALRRGGRVGPASFVSFVVANAPPRITRVSIEPSSPSSDGPLIAEVSAFDADGDTITFAYVWTVNGAVVGTAPELTGGVRAGDEVQVEVIPEDGMTSGEAVLSEVVIVGNGSPEAPLPVLTGDADWIPSAMRCAVEDLPEDPDGDTVVLEMRWVVDGIARAAVETPEAFIEVARDEVRAGGVWGCEARAVDPSGAASDWIAAEGTLDQSCERDIVVFTADRSVSIAYSSGVTWNDTILRAYTYYTSSFGNDDVVGWMGFDLSTLGTVRGLSEAHLSVHVSSRFEDPDVVVVQSDETGWDPDGVGRAGLVRRGAVSEAQESFIPGERVRIALDVQAWTEGPVSGASAVTLGLDNVEEDEGHVYFASAMATTLAPELELVVCR